MGELPPELLQWMRFSPSHEKAIEILISKITGNRKEPDFIFEAEKSNLEPLDLKNLCLDWSDSRGIKIKYPEWWFFSPPNRKGKGMERTTQSGFWKVTCQPTNFMLDSVLIGKKDILVFYEGRGKGKRTNWKIHQYQVTRKELDGTHPGQRPFVLSRLFYDDESLVQHLKFAGLAVPSRLPALEVQATTTPENFGKTISSTITPVDCDGKSFSAHAAENQFRKHTATEDDLQQEEVEEMIYELLQRPVDFEILAPSPSLHNNSAVSLPTTAKSSLEELESKQAFALESPSSEEQSDNYLRKGHPEEIFDGTIATALSNCNQNGYNATASEFQEGFGLSDLQVPLDRSLSSPLTSDMHFGLSHSISNDYNSHCGTYSEYGKNELSKFDDKFPDLASDFLSENFSNTFGCQKNLLLVSMKDNGACSGSDAKMANDSFQEGFGLSDLQVPLDRSLSSPLTSDMHFGMSQSISNDYNSHCGTSTEYGMSELSKFGDEFSDLASDYHSENFSNMFGCQKDLPLVSMKDNGSCGGLDAKLANTLVSGGTHIHFFMENDRLPFYYSFTIFIF
ncbi:hypothetical protein I3843_05G185300 [Carya illinoinensis]|nr:hypothetical protein I3760_05G203700 [Carya illinoinensis]KAG7980495.1 hypothetical protein I3843_05G185300 [Carya illinoinensis]